MLLDQEISINAVKGLFILFLVIVANFLGTTLNCRVQGSLKHSALTRNIAIFFLIYFTINFYSQPENHMIDQIKSTFIIYILFILLMKQHETFFVINLIFIIVIFLISQNREYHIKNNKKEEVVKLEKRINILKIILLVSLLIGFIIYLRGEMKLEKNNFNFIHFLFGNKTCNKS